MVQEKSPKDSVPDIAKIHHLDGYNTQKTINNVYKKIKKKKKPKRLLPKTITTLEICYFFLENFKPEEAKMKAKWMKPF